MGDGGFENSLSFTTNVISAVIMMLDMVMITRVSQKKQKSEFWNITYPSGYHRLDVAPEKISAL